MNLRRTLMLPLILAAFCIPRGASATSLYSMVLLGEAVESGDVRAISLGGSTQLFVDSLGAVQSNPALMARIPRMTIGATQYVALDQGRSDEYAERDISFTFSSLRLVFPIAGRFRFSVGYTGRYEPDGTFSTRGATEGGNGYTETYKRSGGVFSVPITGSLNVTRYASVGLTFSLERGVVQERWDTIFDDPGFVPGAGLKKEDLSGTGLAGGLVLYPTEGVTIGAVYESAIDYDTEVVERYTQIPLGTSYSSTLTLPRRVSAGGTWRLGEKFMVLASGAWRDFGDFEGLGFHGEKLTSERSYSIGIEYPRGVRVRGKRIPLRAGFNYQRLPFESPVGQPVEKYLASIGTGFGIRNGKGKVDVALLVGRVGSMKTNGLEDRLIRIYVGVCGSELWKRKGGQVF